MPEIFPDPNVQPGQHETRKPLIPDTAKNQPAGVVPKRAQIYIVAGLAALLVFVMFFAGSTQPRQRKPVTTEPSASTLTPDKIKQFENELNEEVARQRQQAQRAALTASAAPPAQGTVGAGLANGPATPVNRLGDPHAPTYPPPYPGYGIDQQAPPRRPQASGLHGSKMHDSLFASNVALTYRKAAQANTLPPAATLLGEPDADLPNDQGVTLRAAAITAPSVRPNGPINAESGARRGEPSPPSSGDTYRLFEGTIVETVLTNRLDGSFAGPANCMVTTDVYSPDYQHVLIPQGSRVLGEVKPVNELGQQRLAVVFHRLIMPDGYSVSLDQFRGLDQAGATGLRDKVNHHYVQIFGTSLALGAIGGLAQIGNNYTGYGYDPVTQYRIGMTESMSQSAYQILDRFLNILPTFTIREGSRVKIYLSNDLSLPDYSNHPAPGNS